MLKSNPIIKEYELQEGIYLSNFAFQLFGIEGHYKKSYEFEFNDWQKDAYGVCDSIDNLLETIPELQASEREFVVLLTPIVKHDQPSDGGWRWRKWGNYIGKQTPTTEYLYDEPIIESVYVYRVYEKVED